MRQTCSSHPASLLDAVGDAELFDEDEELPDDEEEDDAVAIS